MQKWNTSKDGIILINYFHLSLSQKPGIKTIIKSFCPVLFLRIFT